MWNKNGSSKKNNIMKRKLRINGHSHLLPYPEQIPSFMKEKEIFWVDDERKHMLQKGWRRPVTDSSFFLDEKLLWMEKNRLDHAVVLNLSQLYGNGLRLEEMKKALRFQNDFNAKVQQDYPSWLYSRSIMGDRALCRGIRIKSSVFTNAFYGFYREVALCF